VASGQRGLRPSGWRNVFWGGWASPLGSNLNNSSTITPVKSRQAAWISRRVWRLANGTGSGASGGRGVLEGLGLPWGRGKQLKDYYTSEDEAGGMDFAARVWRLINKDGD